MNTLAWPEWMTLSNDNAEITLNPTSLDQVGDYFIEVTYITAFGDDPTYIAAAITVTCHSDGITLLSFDYPNQPMWEVSEIKTYEMDPPIFSYCNANSLSYSFWINNVE